MLKSQLKIPSNILSTLQQNSGIKLTAYEMTIITELVKILEPFEFVTNQIQGENIVNSSMVITCVCGLRTNLAILREKYTCKLLSTLQTSVVKRLLQYESVIDFQLACILDPRFKLDFCVDAHEKISMRFLLITF